MSLFDQIERVGLFYRAIYKGNNVSFTSPVFGAPMVAMYVELLPQLGVKNIIACGYVGGLTENQEIGSYVVPTSAFSMDGTTNSYFSYRYTFPSSDLLTRRL